MFSKHQKPKALPYLEEKMGLNPIIALQRYYNTEQEHGSRKIPIIMDEKDQTVSLKQHDHSLSELNAISVVMNRDVKRALWVDDPLRLCLDNGSVEPPTKKSLALELSSHSPESSPVIEPESTYEVISNNEPSSTPTIPPPVILPAELYEPNEHSSPDIENPSLVWLYSRDQNLKMPSTFLHDTRHFTDETWEAIFHPLSTFKHKQGEIEYFAWNPSNLPVAAARVAQRVMNIHTFRPDSMTEATIPKLMPSPPPKPSPVLSENKIKEMSNEKEGHYFDMLKNIRGEDEMYSLNQEKQPVSRIAKKYILDMISTKKLEHHKSYTMEEETPVTTQGMMLDPEICIDEKNQNCTEKRLFWFGFFCPLLWFYGSYYSKARNNSSDPIQMSWQKKCRLASIYFSIILSIVILIASVKAAGSAGIRQAQSGTIRAVIAN